MVTICSETDSKAEILFMFEDGSTYLVESTDVPLTLYQFEDYKRIGCHAYGFYLENNQRFLWQWFGTFPLGTTSEQADSDFRPPEQTRLEIINDSLTRFYFRGEFILERPWDLRTPAGVSTFIDYEYYQYWLNEPFPYFDGEQVRDTIKETNGGLEFGENNFMLFSHIYDKNGNPIYETPPLEHTYDFSCGGCKVNEFPVNDGTKDICVPYDNIIEWSKKQRQRLNQIAKEVNS